MDNFAKFYSKFDGASTKVKKEAILNCARFYEEKTVDYIINNAPKAKQKKSFKKEPVVVEFNESAEDVSFGNNIVFVKESLLDTDKKDLFFKVAQNTICAVFVNLFYNTAGNPNKKTSFGKIANGFFASITSEFAPSKEFEADMMQAYASIMAESMEMGGAEM